MNKKNSHPSKPLKAIKILGIQLLLVAIALVLLFWGLTAWLKSYTKHGEMVPVPEVTLMRVDKSIEILESLGFRYEIVDSVYAEEAQPMDVIDQNPTTGSMVKRGRKVYLTINALGKPQVQAPRLQNRSLRLAKVLIQNSGLSVGTIITKKTDLGDGLVLAPMYRGDTLKPYTMLDKGTAIDLIVSIKPEFGDILNEQGEYESPEVTPADDYSENENP